MFTAQILGGRRQNHRSRTPCGALANLRRFVAHAKRKLWRSRITIAIDGNVVVSKRMVYPSVAAMQPVRHGFVSAPRGQLGRVLLLSTALSGGDIATMNSLMRAENFSGPFFRVPACRRRRRWRRTTTTLRVAMHRGRRPAAAARRRRRLRWRGEQRGSSRSGVSLRAQAGLCLRCPAPGRRQAP